MATKQYTFADVKKHIDQQSTWIVVHNNVYDVTEFLNEHPGGEEVLLEQAGRDASEAFEDVGHSTDARGLMAKYKIGEIVEHERKPVNEKSNINWNTSQDDSQKRILEQILPDFISHDRFNKSSLTQWLVPVALGVIATIIYRFYFQSH